MTERRSRAAAGVDASGTGVGPIPWDPQWARAVVVAGLAEDLGPSGDVTSLATVRADRRGTAWIVAREPLVLAGLPAARMVFAELDPQVAFQAVACDGDAVPGQDQPVARVVGAVRSVLAGERLALNLLQRLSGIATEVTRWCAAVEGLPVRLLDTRKTTPGLRALEKYAVRVGGASNHRMGLFDGILIKDNHIAAAGTIGAAVAAARRHAHPLLNIQVEVETEGQLQQAAAAGADAALLDNMDLDGLRRCVAWARVNAPALRLEASGSVRIENVRDVASTGVHQISSGALVHRARWVDLSLDLVADGT